MAEGAETPGVGRLRKGPVPGVPAHVERDPELHSRVPAGVHQGAPVRPVRHHRLLREDVLAGARGRESLRGVNLVGGGDDDRVELGVREERVEVVVGGRGGRGAVPGGELRGPPAVARVDAPEPGPFRLGDGGGELVVGDPAGGDHGEVDGHHGSRVRCRGSWRRGAARGGGPAPRGPAHSKRAVLGANAGPARLARGGGRSRRGRERALEWPATQAEKTPEAEIPGAEGE